MNNNALQVVNRYCCSNEVVNGLRNDIISACELIIDCFRSGGKLLICGNGGSCADADHIVGEFVKGFVKKRCLSEEDKKKYQQIGEAAGALADKLQYSLPAINLCAHSSLITAIINDIGGNEIFAQQVVGFGKKEDILIGISTSGNSLDVIYAAYTAKVNGMKTIALSGRNGGKMKELFDLSIVVPKDVTSDIQDCHSVIYHTICEAVEAEFFVD